MSFNALPSIDHHKPIDGPDTSQERDTVAEVMSYADYRQFCDVASDSFRRIGLLDAEAYRSAITDERTVFYGRNDVKIPILVPIEYEDRYDAARSAKMTGTEVMLLTMPTVFIENDDIDADCLFGGRELPEDYAILVEDFNEPGVDIDTRQAKQQLIAEALGVFGNMIPHEFIHDGLADDAEHRSAWMAIYGFSIESQRDIPETMRALPEVDALVQAWQDYCAEQMLDPIPNSGSTGAYLFTAEQLREHPEIRQALWGISKTGFGEVLGAHHPISMQVTEAFFNEHIQSETVLTTVKYQDGRPVCFGFMAPNMDHNDWLDCESTVMKRDLLEARQDGASVAHFFELISGGEKDLAQSPAVIGLFLELASRSRDQWHIVFESTNLSDTYIPKIASLSVRRASGKVAMKQPVEMLSQLQYWYLASPQEVAAESAA